MTGNQEAKSLLSAAGIASDQDFETLSEAQLFVIRAEATTAYERKHGKPMPDSSSVYIRKRYALLQQRAGW